MLAGGETELAVAGERLDPLERGETPAQDLLFCGPRGNGNTTLLTETRHRATERGLRVQELPVDALAARETLVRELQERSGLLRDQFSDVQPGPSGAGIERAAPTENVEELLGSWIRSAAEPLVHSGS